MTQEAADSLDEILSGTRADAQAALPEEHKMAEPGQTVCRSRRGGFSCSRALGHSHGHVAHGMSGEILELWGC